MAAATILVRTWICPQCGFQNWPSRMRCKVCERARTGGESRRDDVWNAARIPPGCTLDSLAHARGPMPQAGPAAHGSSRGPMGQNPAVRRIPGLAPPPTGRKVLPSSASGLPGGGGRRGPAGERPQQQLHNVGMGAQRGKGTGNGRGGGGGGGDAADEPGHGTGTGGDTDGDDATRTWARVVRGPRGRKIDVPEGQAERKGDDRESDEGDGEGEAQGRGSSEEGLPPRRTFTPPSQPREVLRRRAEAAAARVQRAKAKGANEEQVRKAAAKADDHAKRLRDAGGATPTSLLFQIKAEEKRKAQSAKSIEALQLQIVDEEEEIRSRQLGIQKLRRAIERHEERLRTSERRLVYLTAQKHSESIPLLGVAELRAAASLLAARKDEAMAPILAVLAALIPPEVHEMEEGDTSSADTGGGEGGGGEGEDVTEEEMDVDGPSRSVDWSCFSGPYAQELCEARNNLRRVQGEMLAAVEAAGEPRREGKRPLGGDGPKVGDPSGDVDMVPNLTPAQVQDSFRQRVQVAADRYRELQRLAAKEQVECVGEQNAQRQGDNAEGGIAEGGARQRGAQGLGGAPGKGEAKGEVERRPPQRAASSGGGRPAAGCIGRWQTDEERAAERGRWRAGKEGPRGRSARPREGGGRSRDPSTRRRAGGARPPGPGAATVAAAAGGQEAAPVTPVDPHVAEKVSDEIGKVREGLTARMEQIVLRVETEAAAERIRGERAATAALKEQERLQLLQEVEFAAACSRRASEAGLQTPHQREKVRSLWVAHMASMGEGPMAEEAFATYGPTGLPLEEQQRALRSAIRRAGVGDTADRGCLGGGGVGAVDDAGGQGHGKAADEEAGSGRSRSKSPRPRAGTRARRE